MAITCFLCAFMCGFAEFYQKWTKNMIISRRSISSREDYGLSATVIMGKNILIEAIPSITCSRLIKILTSLLLMTVQKITP
ncbi:MAG: hypothetical protein U5N85_08375 [Arcicella sp.]|nr:hypothetical protein [Arcicella sp.]